MAAVLLQVKGLVAYLSEKGLDVAGLHGDSSKQERAHTISRLTTGKLAIVVSTDVAARGLDVPTLTHVVNLDLPSSVQQYVHRAGRCGRAGRPGIVLSLTPPSTAFVMAKFAKKLDIKVERVDIAHNRVILFDEADLPPPRPPRQQRQQQKEQAAAIESQTEGGDEAEEQQEA